MGASSSSTSSCRPQLSIYLLLFNSSLDYHLNDVSSSSVISMRDASNSAATKLDFLNFDKQLNQTTYHFPAHTIFEQKGGVVLATSRRKSANVSFLTGHDRDDKISRHSVCDNASKSVV